VSKLPDDPEALKAIILRLQGERDDLHTTNLRLQVELDRLKKRYYGPRADRLETMTDLAQMLLSFAEELDNKPVHPQDASGSPPEQSQQPQQPAQQPQRHLEKSKGRRNLAKFENPNIILATSNGWSTYARNTLVLRVRPKATGRRSRQQLSRKLQ
jgi:hypothetical protein